MYQKDLFTASVGRTAEYLAEGMYSKVYRMTNGKIVKIGENDGTRNWLEFCMMRREAGALMPMMPEVYQVTVLEDGYYMAVMESYFAISNDGLSGVLYSVDFAAVRLEFMYYLQNLTGAEFLPWEVFNDIHSGNVMVCPRRGTLLPTHWQVAIVCLPRLSLIFTKAYQIALYIGLSSALCTY